MLLLVSALFLAGGLAIWQYRRRSRPRAGEDGHWEVFSEPDGGFHHVRWSKPDEQGQHCTSQSYPQKYFADSNAEILNRLGHPPRQWQRRTKTRSGNSWCFLRLRT
jgi:hypothetical protein